MKTIELLKLTLACALGVFVFASCSDDDDDNVSVPDNVQAAFEQKYAGVTRVSWEREDGGYMVAEFMDGGREHDAWFTQGGEWMMTEVDHARNLQYLPQAVQDGYAATRYAQEGWRVEDIDEIQRPGYETIYKIEVEKAGQPDYDLYFDMNGALFREVADGDDDRNEGLVGGSLPAEVQQFVDANFPGARVSDFDRERGGYELELIYGGRSVEVVFDDAYNWVRTSTDLRRDIPANVSQAVNAQYPGKRIDDCDYVETADGEKYYLVDLDNYNMDLKVTPDGVITETPDY